VIVDTNVLFTALLREQSRIRETLLADVQHIFYSPRFVMVELFKHKERLASASELSTEELLECLNALLGHMIFIEEGTIAIGTWMEGRRLCADVDPKDVPFVTLTLHVDGCLWTSDIALESGLRLKGFDQFFRP
jgi:predicted nucleic acid-binding protein